MSLYPAVDAVVARLRPGPDRPALPGGAADPATLAELAARVAAAASLWRDAATTATAGAGPPWSARLLTTDTVEVNLLGWPAGQGTRAHDHGGAVTALWVVQGELVEDCYGEPVWASASARRRLPAGVGVTFPPGHVHVVANPGPAAAVAIQAVSPPSRRPRPRSAGALQLFAELLGPASPPAG